MWDRLEVIEKLGEGGMGEVLKVYDRSRGAVFAAKKLLPHLVKPKDHVRFKREIENLQLLAHPHIVRIVDFSSSLTQPGYLMEYCPRGLNFQSRARVSRKCCSLRGAICLNVRCLDVRPQHQGQNSSSRY
jgi:serine/threonine protein kinase